jgi:hypothetical protein
MTGLLIGQPAFATSRAVGGARLAELVKARSAGTREAKGEANLMEDNRIDD